MIRKSVFSLTSIIGISSVYVLIDEDRRIKVKRTSEACYRIINLVTTVTSIAGHYTYALSFKKSLKQKQVEFQKLLEEMKRLQGEQEQRTFELWKTKDIHIKSTIQDKIEKNGTAISHLAEKIADASAQGDGKSWLSSIHQTSAIKLTNMCKQNKGVYIKIGQHLSMLDHIIPEEYQTELSTLLSKNPNSSIESVRNVFYQEFRKYPEEMFDSFDPLPIASASLAQVHIAYKGNQKLAVKVQHEGLLEGSQFDRYAITIIVDLLSRIFNEFNYNWLSREMNANLPQELDFRNERNNIEKCRKCLQTMIANGDVAVPFVIDHVSGQKVLTMKFEEGFYINDRKHILSMGLHPSDIARLTSTTFYEQIFRHGFVHCDPHEANLLIRKHPWKKGKPQLVLLDHGLYKELSNEFRMNYCRLWRGIVCSNENEIKKYATNLNAGDLFTILAAILTMRSWDDITSDDISRLKSKRTAAEKEKLKFYAQRYFKDIVNLLGNVPSDMLLLLKTNDCLRHIDKQLGAPINTATVIAAIAADVIVREDLMMASSNKSRLDAVSSYLHVQLRLIGFRIAEYVLAFQSYRSSLWNKSSPSPSPSPLSLSSLSTVKQM